MTRSLKKLCTIMMLIALVNPAALGMGLVASTEAPADRVISALLIEVADYKKLHDADKSYIALVERQRDDAIKLSAEEKPFLPTSLVALLGILAGFGLAKAL